jgi:hypothetical protein
VQQFRLAAAVPLGEKGAQALLHLPSDLGALLHAWPSSALRPDHPCTLCSKLDRAEACMPAAETGRQRKSAAVRCAACMKDRKGCSWQHDAPAGAPAAVSPAEQALGRASDLYWAATLERLAGTGAGPSDALAAICASIHKRSPGNDAQTRALLTELAGAALQGPREMSVATAASAALAVSDVSIACPRKKLRRRRTSACPVSSVRHLDVSALSGTLLYNRDCAEVSRHPLHASPAPAASPRICVLREGSRSSQLAASHT